MRLIDADALMGHLRRAAGCETCDNYSGLKCRACPWDDAMLEVDDWADDNQVNMADFQNLPNFYK